MTEFTPRYGAITSIVDSRTTYSMSDSTGTEYLFEFHQLNILEEDILDFEKKLSQNRWLIHYTTDFKPPTDEDIQNALEDGKLIKIYFAGTAYDNYGLKHSILFDEKSEKYIFNTNNYLITNDLKSLYPLNNEIIDYIKSSASTELLLTSLNNSLRILHTYLYNDISELKKTIKQLQDRIAALEAK